jgi:hypothetical protein
VASGVEAAQDAADKVVVRGEELLFLLVGFLGQSGADSSLVAGTAPEVEVVLDPGSESGADEQDGYEEEAEAPEQGHEANEDVLHL